MKKNEIEQRVRRRLAEIEAAGLTRRLHPPAGVDLCSNDYLGLADHPAIKARLAEATRTHGCGSTGSRLLRGHRDNFEAVERRFAAFKGTEAALYFGSGYTANVGVLSVFLEEGDIVFSDELNHASLIDGIRLGRARKVVFPHNDVRALEHAIEAERYARQRFLVTESLFSMEGDFAPLTEYAALCDGTGMALIVDEAHAVGVYGERGSGLIEEAGCGDAVFLSVNTAGKALGVAGAFVAGPEWAIDYLVQRARSFVFSTAPPPALAEAVDAALTVMGAEPERRQRLKMLSARLRTLLAESGLEVPPGISQIIPIILGDNDRAVAAAAALAEQGFDVRAIRPPSVPEGTARLRLSVNVKLDDAVIERLVAALAVAVETASPAAAAVPARNR